MLYTIDLATIATSENSPAYAWFLNREFELDIDERKFEQFAMFNDFVMHPSAQRFLLVHNLNQSWPSRCRMSSIAFPCTIRSC